MIKNNKGFMLAEIIIVAAILIATMVALYAGYSKVFSAYDERGKYYDTDSLYALRNIQNYLVDNMVFNGLINEAKENDLIYIENDDIVDTNSNKLSDVETNYLKEVMNDYNLKYVILTLYDKEQIDDIDTILSDAVIKDFSDYIVDNLDFSESYKYLFISITEDGKCAFLKGV